MNKDIVFEIGTEELPAIELHKATKQVVDLVCNQKGRYFDYEEINIYTTPRRIIVSVSGVPEKIPAKVEEFSGPKIEIAYVDGKPSKACIGFAKSKGVEVEDLIEKDGHIFAVKNTPEKNVKDLLPDLFLGLINDIKWEKVQRWGSNSQEFARPIRWICAMFGNEVVDLEYAGVKSSNVTYGHRFLAPKAIELNQAKDLIDSLTKAYVVCTEEQREQIIRSQVSDIEKKHNLKASLPENIMREVVNLCEYPTCMVGKFNELFLSVPKEIIVDAMLVHQRYFPLFDLDGNLTNNFIIISNGNPECAETIIDGNQRVVDARLYDAKFFFDEDKKNPLESYVEKLKDVVFQEQLGTMYEKAHRIANLSEYIAKESGQSETDISDSKRAGLLAKADLVTNAVVEFTQVQGIMGYYYATASNENTSVANAVKEHYMPRFANDEVPSSCVSKCVALADKIDTLCGMFAVNQLPTGSSDPFALRRGAIGIISIMNSGLSFSFVSAVNFALDQFESQGIKFDRAEVFENIIDFVITRTKVSLKDLGIDHDSIEAVASVKVNEPLDFIARAKALDIARKQNPEVFEDLATAFARANNLCDSKFGTEYNTSILLDVENKLTESLANAKDKIAGHLSKKSYDGAIDELAKLREPIDKFFDQVMIMDKDEKLKENRLKILNSFVEVFSDIADFSKMAKTKK